MAAKALELTILCATRTNETIGAEWSDVDFENATWTIPAIKMKAEREHVIPLTADAVQVLRFMANRQLSNWIFPGRDPRKPVSNMTMLKLLKTLEPDFTVHGFRSAFRDWAGNETSQPRDIIEMSLAHTVGDKTELAYRRDTALNKRRKLMEAWAAYLNPAVDGVVKLHG
jgi:integrase